MQNIPDNVDSKFRLVLLAAERAEQLVRGAAARTPVRREKAARTALDEICGDLVEWGYGPAPEPEPVAVEDEGAVEEAAVA